jgi:Tfp pilus assembly protein PilX
MTVGRSRPNSIRRRGAALVMALATLVLLMAVAVALHAVALRERRSARRATLVRAASDAAEGALARWQARLGSADDADTMVAALAGDAEGVNRELERGAGAGSGGDPGERVIAAQTHVTLVTFAHGVRLLVSEGTASAGGMRARRRVSLILVPDSVNLPADSSSAHNGSNVAADSAAGRSGAGTTAAIRLRLLPAPERPWAELP